MITPQIQVTNSSSPTYLIFNKPITTTSLHGGGGSISIYPSFRVRTSRPISFPNHRRCNTSKRIKAVAMTEEENKKSIMKVKATIRVQPTVGGIFSEMAIERGLDDITDLFGKSLLLELVSSTLHQTTALEKETISGYAHRTDQSAEEVKYEAELVVPPGFGEIGAIFVENEHRREMFIKDIVLDGFETGPLRFSCDSWVHSKFDNPVKRLFFTNKSYLPSETPEGLKRLRGEELELLRGNGHGERKTFDRIYDYDVYNDLGDPDNDIQLKRPVLGGKHNPYPRRCRTGRPRSKADNIDPLSEERSSSIYVPRDESFSEVKQLTFSAKTVYSVLHAVVPAVQMAIVDRDLGFELFSHIDDLFHEGIGLPPSKNKGVLRNMLPRLIKFINETQDDLLRFEPPAPMDRDRFFWFRDEEFGRQTLAGLNPCCIQLVTEWPLKSKLDPNVYGPAESAITKELVEKEIRGFCTVEEAIQAKKLFVLDYHDLLLPVVEQVRELQGTTLYGSRALFFLTPEGTLRPLAIELVRPPINGKPQWKQVYSPTWHSTGVWLWRLAKAHLLAHDSGYHQLVSHWLRTHCCTEPYIIATNRQLSAMHPIYRLLNPHFRYTMEINALAREALINADGIIETSFTPKKYSILLSSIAYDKHWQFNLQSLPNDLIHRGMAVKDDNAPHGLRLTIEDYPYANDGLILWDALKGWITDYVDRYYSDSDLVRSDEELQAWWHEIKNVGHGDKKDEPWWPLLNTKEDLVQILTTIVWIASGHHAAVNFGQYDYAGYFPNRPTIARKKMPTEDPTEEEWEEFMEKPEMALLKCFPSQIQATTVMAVLDILSSHSPEEEYLGESIEPSWEEDPIVKGAFEKFKGKLLELEGEIDRRNADRQRKNRNGAGMLPYQLLKPVSEPGVTGKGVPYSISI
ncbi:linoleate 13S-lipoxygenase 2-1, chloroplastic-like [Arachis stenosperma]|uniref:linoleate 13S-lipoxygenase 2-1, chloroplastic-like n=1 Tax=Arachis stenosperma TaxID=217475 RepID=UPI0025AC5612|nr:linoleate 13S-lipoxygenase 2-1, chloroplastic-like [Arachis stenosperma]